jgi:hypothetical protein
MARKRGGDGSSKNERVDTAEATTLRAEKVFRPFFLDDLLRGKDYGGKTTKIFRPFS